MRRALGLLLLAAMTAAACTGGPEPVAGPEPERDPAADVVTGSGRAAPPPVAGGMVRVRAPAEPPTMNPWAAPGDASVGLVSLPVLAPLWRTGPDGAVQPWLLAGEPDVTTDDDGTPTVVYEVRDDAVWSDGQPVDGRDVLFTLDACRALPVEARGGQPCGAVDVAASGADGRRATVVFTRPVGAWRTLLADLPVLPEHVLGGADIRDVWAHALPVSSGPFRFASWTRGERVVLVRNERWWGDRPPLDRIEIVFDRTAGIAALLDSSIDVTAIDATLANLERARASARVRVAVAAGPAVEALDFNVASPRVGRAAVRGALAAALDPDVLVDEVVRPIVPSARPRRRLLFDPAAGAADPTASADVGAGDLAGVGCRIGADGLAVCDGARMRLRLDTTDASRPHRVVAEYVTSQLAEVGVEVVDAGQGGGWDLRLGTIDTADPLTMGRRWRCDGAANAQAYCNPALDDLLDRAAQLPPGDERAAVLADADLLLARDRPTYPLYPVPQMLAYRSAVRGPAINDGPWGVTWNAEQWARTAITAD